MICLDTNVLSEMMKFTPDAAVSAWFGRIETVPLCTTTVCQAEIMAGIAVLPHGKRRRALESSAAFIFANAFTAPILTFDGSAVSHYADVKAERRRRGRMTRPLDAMIAAIALCHGAAIATRNVKDFEGCGLTIHDPWGDA